MKKIMLNNKKKIISLLLIIFCFSVITFIYSKYMSNNLKPNGNGNLYDINQVKYHNFVKEKNEFFADETSDTKVLQQNIALHNYSGYYVSFDVYSEEDGNDTIYLDLFNGEENYDSDNQQIEFKINKGSNHFEGVLQTQVAPNNADVRIVYPGKNVINVAINNIEKISNFSFILKTASKIFGLVTIGLILLILYLTREESNKSTGNRNTTIDILKGIGVYLVILGHLVRPNEVGEGAWGYIYSFHMPMFFIISGYLFRIKDNSRWIDFFKNKVKHIFLPYTILFVVSLISYNVIFDSKIYELKEVSSLIKAYVFSGNYLDKSSVGNFPLWFLPLLFIAVNTFYFISKIKNMYLFIVVLLVIAVSSIPFQSFFEPYCILEINVLPVAIVFLGIGYLFKKYENKIKNDYRITVVCLLLGIVIAARNSSLSVMNIGTLLYYIGASCTVYALYRIFNNFKFEVIRYMGENSLITYGIHPLIITLCWKLEIMQTLFKNYTGMSLLLTNVTVVYIMDFVVCKAYYLVKENLRR